MFPAPDLRWGHVGRFLPDSVALALMCDKISAAVRLLMPRVQGIMGCCTDGAEG